MLLLLSRFPAINGKNEFQALVHVHSSHKKVTVLYLYKYTSIELNLLSLLITVLRCCRVGMQEQCCQLLVYYCLCRMSSTDDSKSLLTSAKLISGEHNVLSTSTVHKYEVQIYCMKCFCFLYSLEYIFFSRSIFVAFNERQRSTVVQSVDVQVLEYQRASQLQVLNGFPISTLCIGLNFMDTYSSWYLAICIKQARASQLATRVLEQLLVARVLSTESLARSLGSLLEYSSILFPFYVQYLLLY